MFPFLAPRDVGLDAIAKLADRLYEARGFSKSNSDVLAGYTYLGQFVDHDITFDAISKLQRDNDPRALVNFRTPRFDLDSLYGSGPVDQPFLYDWDCNEPRGVKFLIGCNPPDCHLARVDLPRNVQGRALIGDARNDENLIVSQLHLMFIRFHNRVVEHLGGCDADLSCTELFEQAQRTVRWHYQWIVVHEFLKKVVGDTMACAVVPRLVDEPGLMTPRTMRRIYSWRGEPYMPVEFSGAAFRFGHSMVRSDYVLNREHPEGATILPVKGRRHDLGGFRWLPDFAKIDWSMFFDPPAPPARGPVDAPARDRIEPAKSMRMDHGIVGPLHLLPGGKSLPFLNLRRGRALGLPPGPDVAQAMGQAPLSEAELFATEHDPSFWPPTVESAARELIRRAPPLWLYLLREAHVTAKGKHLGPVGGRIAAEVLVGLLEGDPNSYLRQQPTWTPDLPRAREDLPKDDFTMFDLVTFTDSGEKGGAPPPP